MTDKLYLNQYELAKRWGISHRTLERWRWQGEGLKFTKIGGHVAYRISDIEKFEEDNVRTSTSDMGGAA